MFLSGDWSKYLTHWDIPTILISYCVHLNIIYIFLYLKITLLSLFIIAATENTASLSTLPLSVFATIA